MSFDWKHFVLSHTVWIAAVTVALIMGHSMLAEHDQRLIAEQTIKVSQAQVKDLQAQIAQTSAAAAQKVQVVTKIVHDAATPTQAVIAIPQLTDAPLNARVSTDNPAQVSVDAAVFIGLLGQAKTDAINLAACADNLKSETAIVTQKDIQIAALRKKPTFWRRVEGTAKAVGVGIGIGFLIAGHA